MAQTQSKQFNIASKRNLVLGATGVAVAAGLVAAGVALSNRKTREKVGKRLQNGFKTVGEIASERYHMGEKGGSAVKTSKTTRKKTSSRSQPMMENKVAAHQISITGKKRGRPAKSKKTATKKQI